MPTINNIIGGVRLHLRTPSEDKIGDGKIAEYLLRKIDYYLNELNLTDQNWLLEKWQLDVDASTQIYTVNPSSAPFGRPILCETMDESDPFHERREITIVDLQDRDLFYRGPQQAWATAPPHSAITMTFFRSGGQKRVLVEPQPAVSASYRFWFEPSRMLPQSITNDSPFLENFSNLLEVDTALTVLPDCDWPDVKHNRIEKALGADLVRYTAQFDRYKNQDRQEQVNTKRGFGDDWDF